MQKEFLLNHLKSELEKLTLINVYELKLNPNLAPYRAWENVTGSKWVQINDNVRSFIEDIFTLNERTPQDLLTEWLDDLETAKDPSSLSESDAFEALYYAIILTAIDCFR